MGYNLCIGELEVEYTQEGNYCGIGVKTYHHDNAPAFGEPTDKTSQRWPGYIVWQDFCEFVGLEDVFYNEEYGILRNHPGAVPLTEEHRDAVNKAYEDFIVKYPNTIPGFGNNVRYSAFGDFADHPRENCHFARLLWLKYWVNWCLDNCERPIFYNN